MSIATSVNGLCFRWPKFHWYVAAGVIINKHCPRMSNVFANVLPPKICQCLQWMAIVLTLEIDETDQIGLTSLKYSSGNNDLAHWFPQYLNAP
jgi:hypothetical protein